MRKLLALSLALFISACSTGITTNTDYRPEFNFSTIKTYKYLEFEDKNSIQNIYTDRTETALNNTLKLKGLSLSADKPDIIIAYHIVTEKKEKQRITTSGSLYFGKRYMGSSISMGTTHIDNIEYNVGNMVVDFIKPGSRKIIWHGEATAKIDMARTPEERSSMIQEAVNILLKDFPPLEL